MFNNGSRAKFQSLCKQMLESSSKANFKRSVQKLEDFLEEEPRHAKLKDWLNWWVLCKEHIFRAFKDTLSPHSNLVEVIHSSWVSTKRTHLSIYECTLDDVAEFVTIKQMLKGYEEGNFGGGTGPSYMQINSRKDARNIKASFTVIEEDSSPIHYNDENDGFSPPRKRRSQSKSKTKKITKNVSSSKCDDSPNEASFDDLSQEESSENVTSDEEKRLGNERPKRSSTFMIAMKNMKEFAQKTSIISMGEQDKCHKWFHVSSGRNNAISYTVDIRRELRCSCEYFVQKNTPCKHILYIMMKVFNVKESSYILQQIYLTKKQIKNLFNCCLSTVVTWARVSFLIKLQAWGLQIY